MINDALFEGDIALTFDDLLVCPGYSEVLPTQVNTRARIAGDVTINSPILSAAMDTVTESRLAIALARMGGMGVIHRNWSIEDQAGDVYKVKRSESGMISDPVSLPDTATLADAERMMETYHVSGIPVVMQGSNVLVGIITNRDRRFCVAEDRQKPVSAFMTKSNLVTAPIGTTVEMAKTILHAHRIEKLPLVDESGRLCGLITVKDIQKKLDFPDAAVDSRGRLLVGAAVGVGPDLEERAHKLIEAGVDILVIDTAHGHSKMVINAIARIKAMSRSTPVMAGNVVTEAGTLALIEAGADAIKVGVGSGSICTTRIISGAGMPQLQALYSCAKAARRKDIPLIADGGIKYSGDIVKAIATGADAVMLGSLLAGLDESPGEMLQYEGRQYKTYRGMGSVAALKGYGKDRYGLQDRTGNPMNGKIVPEGVEGMVPYRGKLTDYATQLLGGLRSGMGYSGAANIEDLKTKTKLVRISTAGLYESHPHSVVITREAPNYQRGEQKGE